MDDKKAILSLIGDEDIIRQYFPEQVEIGKKYVSPYRIDNDPNCEFRKTSSGLVFSDWAINKHYDCFEICRLYLETSGRPSSFFHVIQEISRTFKLNLFETSFSRKEMTENKEIEIKKPLSNTYTKKELLIVPMFRNFTKEELKWWLQYGIDENSLKRSNVYSCKSVWIGKILLTSSDTFPIYAYRFDVDNIYKYQIYMPMGKKSRRFTQNLPTGFLMGYANNIYNEKAMHNYFNEGNNVIFITSSYKDVILLNSLGYVAVCPIGESGSIDLKLIDQIIMYFKNNIVLLMNNDNAGKIATEKLKKTFKNKKVCPIDLSNIMVVAKDPTDVVKEIGKEQLKLLINSSLVEK